MRLNHHRRRVSYVIRKEGRDMNALPQSEIPAGPLTPETWEAPIRVRLAPFVEFSQQLDEALERLVIQWQDKAAPCATRRGR
jgi:hypothetical protein